VAPGRQLPGRGDADPPPAGEGVTATLSPFERSNGDAQGQGVGDVWWVLRPDATPVKPGATTGDGNPDGGDGGY